MHAYYLSSSKSLTRHLSLAISALLAATGNKRNTFVAVNAVLIDVPGCNCDASLCKPFLLDESRRSDSPDACVFAKQFQDMIVQQTSSSSSSSPLPLCDAMENSPEFIDIYGISSYADSYPTEREIPVSLRSGTCAQAYEYQNSCGAGGGNVRGGDDDDSGIYSGMTFIASSGRGCTTHRMELPSGTTGTTDTATKLRFTANCASSYSYITEASENELLVFIETGGGGADEDGGSLCNREMDSDIAGDVRGKYTPRLTSKDWIEPVPGRRYMCYEFRDPNNVEKMYNFLFMSVGNEPCDGPKSKAEGKEGAPPPVIVDLSPLGDATDSAARHRLNLNGYGYYLTSMMMFTAVLLCF